MNDTTYFGKYEQPIELDAIIKKTQLEQIQKYLQTILQQSVIFQAAPEDGYFCVPIIYEFEPVAHICVPTYSPLLPAVGELIEMIIFERIRYHLAESLHVETIQRDFESLREKNIELMDSELRYRELAEQLEMKVKEQTQVIDARQRQLYQSERTRAIGQLAAGMAHEINNPLSFIGSNLNTAESYVKEIYEWLNHKSDNAQVLLLDDFSDLLEEAKEGVFRISEIIKNLRTFSNIDSNEIIPISINSILESTLGIIKTQCPENILIYTQLNEIPSIVGWPAKLAQAFFNILQNGIESMPMGGQLEIITTTSKEDIYVIIQDTGIGMSEEQIAQVRNPFYTTKKVGAGPGLGLTVANEVANLHKGKLEFISTLNKGTEVIFSIPLAKKSE